MLAQDELGEGALADLAGAVEDDHAGVFEGIEDQVGGVAGQVFGGSAHGFRLPVGLRSADAGTFDLPMGWL
nr:hypothetical protein GCM10020063_099490 [Dactylosporangium thailandense]